ncbi:MAG TPA: ABC transporter ATP-binding protein [Thermoanaerobaculia bacterium]|nr:ABC transporter ATP-binding protein [Thermoanaerobaculia bacterium]
MSQTPPAAPVELALRVENVSWAYTRHRRSLDGVSFEVPPGSFTGLLGPNGAGKTTLMALITRLFAAREGRIRIAGYDLARQSRAALASIGVVFQRPTLDLDLNVEQNLRYAARLYGLAGAAAAARIGEGLERLALAGHRKAPVRTLSGGMRRRVELVRALLHSPRLLVLDEPTVGLDVESRRTIVAHVHELCAGDGLAALWATHLVDEIHDGDRVVVLHQGRVQARGRLDEVLAAAGASDLVEAFARLTPGAAGGAAEIA